ncbi:MAG: hypothetical protein L3J86_04315, partial [Thermoplasmata archaeon]|nr:hypothetical protein [Thermoplasmata archaeon]
DIAVRVSSWGARATVEFPVERVREIALSPTFRAKVKGVVQELGANRDSELMTVALLTAEIAGIDVMATLKLASDHRESAAANTADDAIGELGAVVGDLARSSPQALGADDGITRLKQSAIAEELNRRRRESGKFALGTQRLAKAPPSGSPGWTRSGRDCRPCTHADPPRFPRFPSSSGREGGVGGLGEPSLAGSGTSSSARQARSR